MHGGVGEAGRERIVALLGVPAGKIVVAGCGVDATFCIDGPKREAGRPYLLWVGNHKPHKNTERMMAAYARSRASLSCDLILVARATPAIRKHAATLGIAERVHWLNDVDDAELAALYRGATGLLLPSLIEGFGLPLAEAMACGTPCLVSAAASLHEVAGEAALAVDPLDIAATATGIDRRVEDEPLRKELARRGPERAAAFEWEDVAARVRRVLEDALAEATA